MSRNSVAKGIVLVPSLLLGSAFLAAAAWGGGPEGANRSLALALGLMLIGVGIVSQLLPDQDTDDTPDPGDVDTGAPDRGAKGS